MRPIYESKGYWDQISSYRFFLHAWSLGVELEFYLMAPIILGATNGWNKVYRCSLLVVLAVSSFALQLLSTTNMSYGFIFCRIWQFLLGSFVFESKECTRLEKSSHNPSTVPPISDFILLIMFTVVVVNLPFMNQGSMRLFGTSATALMIYLSEKCPSWLLSKRVLVHMGDVSYSLYLIHWPVIVATKYYLNENPLRTEALVVLFAATIVLAGIFHHLVEKNLILCETRISVTVVIICIFTIIVTSSLYTTTDLRVFETKWQTTEITTHIDYLETFAKDYDCPLYGQLIQGWTHSDISAAIEWNTRESKKGYFPVPCDRDIEARRWTKLTKEEQMRCHKKGPGKSKILVLGNSIAYRAFPLLNDILKNRYSELRLFTISSCVPLYNDCPRFTNASHIVVDKMRPDILIIIWLTSSTDLLGPVTSFVNDTALQIMQQNMDYYSKRSKHVILDMPYHFLENFRVAYEVAKRLHQNIPLTDLKRTKQDDVAQQHFLRARIEHLNCSNCILNRVNEALFEGEFMYLYNRSSLHAYTGDGSHLTPEGLELVRPKYEEVLEPLLENN